MTSQGASSSESLEDQQTLELWANGNKGLSRGSMAHAHPGLHDELLLVSVSLLVSLSCHVFANILI